MKEEWEEVNKRMMENEVVRSFTVADYNRLAEDRANAVYMWGKTRRSSYYENIWDRCRCDMQRLEKIVHNEGYKFIEIGTRVKNKVPSSIYIMVKIDE